MSSEDPSTERAGSSTSLLALIPDRAQLEKERLARVAARERRTNTQKRARSTSPTAPDEVPPRAKASAHAIHPRYIPISPEDRFWKGALKATYNRYARVSKAGSTLAQAIAPASSTERCGLERVLLTSYDVEIDWIESLFPANVPVTYIGNPPRGDSRTDPSVPSPGFYASDTMPNWEMCIPKKPHPRALQHMKLLLLYYSTHLRVIVSTANLTQLDWSRYENMLYVQDFPTNSNPLAEKQAPNPTCSGSDFLVQLQRVLHSLTVPNNHAAFTLLHNYDFDYAAAHLVASWPVAPVARGWAQMEQAGLARLGSVIRRFSLPYSRHMHLEAQGSSLAAYDRRWLEQFYLIAQGHDPVGLLPITPRQGDSASLEFSQATGLQGWPDMYILFPTQSWVEHQSIEGRMGGGCFFGRASEFKKKNWHHLYAQPISHRGYMMMHAKTILAQWDDPSVGWVYVGSHNFTRAAWGTISGSRDQPTQSISNWELGIVLPLDSTNIEGESMDAIPYRQPVTPYSPSDTPWDVDS